MVPPSAARAFGSRVALPRSNRTFPDSSTYRRLEATRSTFACPVPTCVTGRAFAAFAAAATRSTAFA